MHLAVKRGHHHLINFLVERGNRVDVIDCIGRTPLHIACINNDEECVKKLLYEIADPFKYLKEKKPQELTKNNNIKYYINRAKLVLIIFYFFSSILLIELII